MHSIWKQNSSHALSGSKVAQRFLPRLASAAAALHRLHTRIHVAKSDFISNSSPVLHVEWVWTGFSPANS